MKSTTEPISGKKRVGERELITGGAVRFVPRCINVLTPDKKTYHLGFELPDLEGCP